MRRKELSDITQVELRRLDAWIEEGWLLPRTEDDDFSFSEVDAARAQLIRDLGEMGMNDESIPVILDLIDQVHGIRQSLRRLLLNIQEQPDEVRRQILSPEAPGTK